MIYVQVGNRVEPLPAPADTQHIVEWVVGSQNYQHHRELKRTNRSYGQDHGVQKEILLEPVVLYAPSKELELGRTGSAADARRRAQWYRGTPAVVTAPQGSELYIYDSFTVNTNGALVPSTDRHCVATLFFPDNGGQISVFNTLYCVHRYHSPSIARR